MVARKPQLCIHPSSMTRVVRASRVGMGALAQSDVCLPMTDRLKRPTIWMTQSRDIFLEGEEEIVDTARERKSARMMTSVCPIPKAKGSWRTSLGEGETSITVG